MITELPFGRHARQPLAEIPTSYLAWLLREAKLSSGLRGAVADEYRRRGGEPPPPPPPKPPPSCWRCGLAGLRYDWMETRNGVKQIRRACARCGGSLGFAPQVEPYLGLANAAAAPSPVLDVLARCEELGVRLRSDGAVADFATNEDWARATPEVRRLLRQCRSLVGRMMGKGGEG